MTSTMRHRPKRLHKQQGNKKIVLQNECITETPVASYDPQKFVFDNSDDEELSIRHTAHSSFFNKNKNNNEMTT